MVVVVRRTLRSGGDWEICHGSRLPKTKQKRGSQRAHAAEGEKSRQNQLFFTQFFNAHRKLACRGGGWQTVFAMEYRKILNQTITPHAHQLLCSCYGFMDNKKLFENFEMW